MNDRRTMMEIDLDSVIDRLVEGACIRVNHVGDRRPTNEIGGVHGSGRLNVLPAEHNA
jgi:hypothetical protein